MTCIDIEIDDYLSGASDFALESEIRRRKRQSGAQTETHPWTREGIAADIRTAFYARNAARLEMLLAQLECWEAA